MSSVKPIALVLLVAGSVFALWGLNAAESFAAEISKTMDAQPPETSSSSIWLTAAGGVLAAIGLVGLFKRP